MKWQAIFIVSVLLALLGFTGCYTQLGYHASSDFDRRYHTALADKDTEQRAERHTDIEEEVLETEDSETETDEGYYGRRRYTRRSTYVYPDTYWGTYAPYPYRYYMPVHPYYYGYPWYRYHYGYAPFYRYYSGYYPYSRAYSGRRYVPLSRRTHTPRRSWHPENRRSRSSRGVTAPRSRSGRPRR